MIGTIKKIIYPEEVAENILNSIFDNEITINPARDITLQALIPTSRIEFLNELKDCLIIAIDSKIAEIQDEIDHPKTETKHKSTKCVKA